VTGLLAASPDARRIEPDAAPFVNGVTLAVDGGRAVRGADPESAADPS
jgi:hypothetical protein